MSTPEFVITPKAAFRIAEIVSITFACGGYEVRFADGGSVSVEDSVFTITEALSAALCDPKPQVSINVGGVAEALRTLQVTPWPPGSAPCDSKKATTVDDMPRITVADGPKES